MTTRNIGLIGLGTMGRNLAFNLAEHGFFISVFNRSESKTREFLQEAKGAGVSLDGYYNIEDFINSLKRPLIILLMIKAGNSIDEVISEINEYLEPGDLVADLGNSFYLDTVRRQRVFHEKGIFYAGVGVSGGEEGARRGPSIMPGGCENARKLLEPVLLSISAEVKEDNGKMNKCCRWIGGDGAGHFVKMVHNGIEYGDMQIISEVYKLMTIKKESTKFRLSNDEASDVFSEWNSTELAGFLNEITVQILKFREPDGSGLINKIRDKAGQKGTGKWTVEEGIKFGQPLTVISEAVFARYLSADVETRKEAAAMTVVQTPDRVFANVGAEEIIEDFKSALLGARIISYLQGFILMNNASEKYSWNINMAAVADIWRGGCIIRSDLLKHIGDAYKRNRHLKLFIIDEYFKDLLGKIEPGWRRTAARAAIWGCPAGGIISALTYYDGIRMESLPSNLIQAQRDFFGNHMYERTDAPEGLLFHTDWQETGGNE